MAKAVVIIPTYNERENIAEMAKRILSVMGGEGPDLLIVDDDSPDGTGDLADGLAAESPRVNVIHGPRKRGLGRAYIEGFRWALRRGYDRVVTMDADLSHDTADIPRLLEGCRDCDLVVGSRYVPGGGVENWPWFRKFISRGGSLYARLVTGLPLSDATGGFNCYGAGLLRKIGIESVRSEGYSFQIEMKHRAFRLKSRVREIPIVFTDRTRGKSKMSKRIVLEALLRCWKLRFSR